MDNKIRSYKKNDEYFHNMRKFHNNIKKELINKYASNCNKLIDFCCGKGGDMHKWINSNIKYVIGYDINENYLKEAQKRYENLKKQKNIYTNIIYKHIDLSSNIINLEGDKADIITCNFALHYFFENEKIFDIFKTSLINNLKINGYFIGTIFDGFSIINNINNQIDKNFDQLFKIDNLNINNTLFGNKIKVYLRDSIIDNISYEYLIFFGKFVSKMEDNGFILIDSKLFSEFEEIKYLENYEQTFSALNRYFVFKFINNKIEDSYKSDNIKNNTNGLNLSYDFDKMKIQDLKNFCKNNNIHNYSNLKKQDLIKHIYSNFNYCSKK